MKVNDQIHLIDLVQKSLHNDIQEGEFRELNRMLLDNDEACQFYNRVMRVYLAIEEYSDLVSTSNETIETILDERIWAALASEEQRAPEIEIPKEEPPRELIQKVDRVKPVPKVSKVSLFATILSSAALIFLLVYAHFAPKRNFSVDVATLVDQLNVQWTSPHQNPENGSRLCTDEGPLNLKQGLVKIRYDNGVDVLIEGPALFALNRSGIFLEYGRLYSCVSRSGLGFRVETPNSQFLDHGTEFGVLSHTDGSSELHVIKGEVELFTGSKGKFKRFQMVTEKKAIRYHAGTGRVDPIPVQKEAFARSIHSESNMVWRGRMRLSLADIIGGGNGFEGGVTDAGIETTTGKFLSRLSTYYPFEGTAGYKVVSSSPYIDGVFIPGAEEGPIPIASEGSCTAAFPHASGRLWGYIFNGAFHQGTPAARSPLQLGGVVYGTPDHPAITIHSNQGITFDLSEIRKSLPGLSITAFRSLAGISQTVQELLENKTDRLLPGSPEKFDSDRSRVEFWIFLDGVQVFHRELSSADEAAELTIAIPASIRFLTLAVTESEDDISYDWALFGHPELVLEPAPGRGLTEDSANDDSI